MDSINYSTFRSQLTKVLDQVNIDHKPILIRRRFGQPVVVMSLDDFKSYEETAHLMSSAKNAERLNRSIEQLQKRKGQRRGLREG